MFKISVVVVDYSKSREYKIIPFLCNTKHEAKKNPGRRNTYLNFVDMDFIAIGEQLNLIQKVLGSIENAGSNNPSLPLERV
jgi:hypothetical protein